MSRIDVENGHRWVTVEEALREWEKALAEREEWSKELSDNELLEAIGKWDAKLLTAARRAL